MQLRKYQPLLSHLQRRKGRPEMLSFEDIEKLIGAELPPSAAKSRSSFWSNNYRDENSHARAWSRAGYRVAYVDREERIVRFERTH
ncbi:hypothetical protein [Terricaulis sp.]|uniref:DUF7662 domain-containing protein n=1 Tax=Terricaulis sp. TaxID=2768686 RepID=UPI003783C62D